MADRWIIDHVDLKIAIAIVAAVHVEVDRRHHPFENIRIFLLRSRGPATPTVLMLSRPRVPSSVSIANLHDIRAAVIAR